MWTSQKAYNIVPRAALIQTLVVLGCSAIMLAAIASMYKVSYGVISLSIIITSIIGVWQGSPTSCFLFTCYVNP